MKYDIVWDFLVQRIQQRTTKKMSKQFQINMYNAKCNSLMIAIYFYDFMISC